MTKYVLTIHHDDHSADMDPLDEANQTQLFRLHSFKRGDWHEANDDFWLCQNDCGEIEDDHPVDESEWAVKCDTFKAREGFWLSHYEHGNRHWSIRGTHSYPDMQWDGVRTAGFLEVVVPENEREWWNGRPDEDKLEAAKITIAEYTSWLNGEVYGYTLENVREEHCDKGFTHTYEGEDVSDSCFGFIGWEWLETEVQMVTSDHGATADNTTIVDKAYGMADYGTFFKKEDANA